MNNIEQKGGESIIREGLLTSPEVIFDEARSLDSLVRAEIPPELLDDMEEMLDDLATVSAEISPDETGPQKARKTIDGIQKADESWQEIISEGREDGEDEHDLDVKDRMRRIVFGVGGIIERKIERENLNQRYRSAGRAESQEIEKRTNELNVEDVKWQQDVVILTLTLARNPRGKEVLSKFWSSFESLYHGLNPKVVSSRSELTIGQQEARNLHNAIVGMVGTMFVLSRIGYDPYLPEPQQDAKGKVDLWAKPKGAPWHEGFIGLQLKTSMNGIRGLEARKIDAHFLDVIGRIGTRKEKRAAQKLRDFLQDYGNHYRVPSFGVWVDLTGSREEEVVDSITGEPHFERKQVEDFHRVLDEHFKKTHFRQRAV